MAADKKVKVAVVAPFFDNTNIDTAVWLDHFVEGDAYEFHHVPRSKPMPKWHDRKSDLTVFPEWLVYMRQAVDAYRLRPNVVISLFPQPAAAAGILKRVFPRTRMIAWLFNVGTCHEG